MNPVEKFKSSRGKNVCFLHSGQGGKSILATNPTDIFNGSSIQKFKKFVQKHKNNLLIGFLSYDLGYQLYNIRQTAKNDLGLPKIYFLAFRDWSEFTTNSKIPKIQSGTKEGKNFKTSLSKRDYKNSYRRIKKYLKDGEIYQVNLTHRLNAETNIPPKELFAKVIDQNPVDFLAYMEGGNFEILSASPERFIKIENNRIETCPIKGTNRRGKNKKEDEKLKKELIESEKEAAELNMITDLLRNDLGKVCKIGTVKVEGHRLLKKCPTVWHTYSKITGTLVTPPIDALISMLPAGSITGCPKKKAIEIIDELEPTTRGIYTGVIGYIHPKGLLDFNIAIRTIVKIGQQLYLQVGGGIVIDSKLEEEYQETLDKATSFMKILN